MSNFYRFNFGQLYQFTKICKGLKVNKTVSRKHIRTLSTTSKPSVYIAKDDDKFFNNPSKYTNRSYTCGELGTNNLGEQVILCGWLEYQRMNKFIVLRDGYGHVQLLLKQNDTENQNLLETIPFESILEVRGTVMPRPKEMVNKKELSGSIEVLVESFKILNKSKENLPFNIREFQKAKEPLRMQYRYLDLRFPQMQRNMRFRSKLSMKMREFLINNHFVDVETPTLFKATPGGAQEFVVPTRYPDQFYSLVQSPQQFKQMLMAGGIDRYFQIARCYRDEGSRSDRQPEFTQLDIEMCFTDVEGVMKLIEELLEYCLGDTLNLKFGKMRFDEAMERFGSDKPDTTFGFELKNCTDILKKSSTLAAGDDFGAYFVCFSPEYANFNRKFGESVKNVTSKFNKAKLVQTVLKNRETFINTIGRLLNKDVATEFLDKNCIPENSSIFLAYGNKNEALSLLGKIRTEFANFLKNVGTDIRKQEFHFLWVVDWPLFELSESDGALQSAHHPFTAPHPDDVHLLSTNPLKIRALSYDLVLNGNEIGGGSIRIHDPVLQKSVLDLLSIKSDTMQHMLEMLESGCPPHGGIALGLDRLLATLLGTTSIRDVIAFPKNYEGRDPLSGAPCNISEDVKKLYHLQTSASRGK